VADVPSAMLRMPDLARERRRAGGDGRL